MRRAATDSAVAFNAEHEAGRIAGQKLHDGEHTMEATRERQEADDEALEEGKRSFHLDEPLGVTCKRPPAGGRRAVLEWPGCGLFGPADLAEIGNGQRPVSPTCPRCEHPRRRSWATGRGSRPRRPQRAYAADPEDRVAARLVGRPGEFFVECVELFVLVLQVVVVAGIDADIHRLDMG